LRTRASLRRRAAAPSARAAPGAAAPRHIASGEWQQWRGPNFNGSSAAKNLPDKFDDTTNVLWSTAMPGPSAGHAGHRGDRVFVSTLDKRRRSCGHVPEPADGKILWQKEVGNGFQQNERNNMAARRR
jgi:hypothetical protein